MPRILLWIRIFLLCQFSWTAGPSAGLAANFCSPLPPPSGTVVPVATVSDLLAGPPFPGRVYQIPVTASAPGFSGIIRASLLVGGTVVHLPMVLR